MGKLCEKESRRTVFDQSLAGKTGFFVQTDNDFASAFDGLGFNNAGQVIALTSRNVQ